MSIETLKNAHQLIIHGRQEAAIRLLMPILKTDRDNKNAWWLLANAASKPEQIELALKNVLRLDPHHIEAQAKLEQLHAQSAAEFFNAVRQIEPDMEVVDAETMSYFAIPEDDMEPDFSDWDSVDSSAIISYAPPKTITPRTTGTYSRVQPQKQRRSGISANFLVAMAGLLVVGVGVIFAILYSAGVLDGVLGILPPPPEPRRGWQTFNGEGVTIQLPQQWEDIDISSATNASLESFLANFPEFAAQIEVSDSNLSDYSFVAVDSTYQANNVVIYSKSIGLFGDLDSYLNNAADELSGSFVVTSQIIREIEPFGEVGIIEATINVYNVPVSRVAYLIKRGNRVWEISFTTETAVINDYLEDFEYSVSTFRP